jgi:REP element-mobilizing transposase RayT
MGMQVSCDIHPKVSAQGDVRMDPQRARADHAGVGATERERGGRFMDRTKNFVGLNFWARGYYVSTVGRDESQVRQYIREQEKEDRRLDQLKMFE